MSERKSAGCPNRDCDHTGDFTEAALGDTGHGVGVWIRCDCGAAGPFALLSDALSDVAVAEAEAWRLWNALPRETGPGEATRRVVSTFAAMIDAAGGRPEPGSFVAAVCLAFGIDDIRAAIRECGIEAES